MLKDKDKYFGASGSYVLSTAFGVVIITIDIGFTASFSGISYIYYAIYQHACVQMEVW